MKRRQRQSKKTGRHPGGRERRQQVNRRKLRREHEERERAAEYDEAIEEIR